ncbi:hypothetical protein ACFLIM_15285 [Nonomuraea sp. M3C6]|uniref:Secreted protein n=1 Tax=Nonomuraea marmarensis TaxID=3351344 RepID=A0ABW7AB19_9ACTN
MSRLIAILAFASAAVALPIAAAGPASANEIEKDEKVTILACTLSDGVVLPDSSSQTHLRCFGGRFDGLPVWGVV